MSAVKSASRPRLRVLVVDDSLDQVHTMAYLVKDMGHDVSYAINAIVALEAAQRYQPDVILLDIGLPDSSGLVLARQLRRDPELRETYIVGVTGLDVARDEALAAGLDELLAKPVEPGVVQDLLAQWSRR